MNFGVVLGNNGNVFNKLIDNVKIFRTGYQFGINGNFGTYSFFISPGIYYQNVTINNQFEKLEPFVKSPRLKTAKAKIIMGYQTDLITKKIKFRIGGGINGNLILNVDDNTENFSINTLEDTYFAYDFDIGIDFFIINFNVSYEKSIKDVFLNGLQKHKFDSFVFSTGILF
jgi:hypothetical protein